MIKNYQDCLNFFIKDIKQEKGDVEGLVHSISYYCNGKDLIGRDVAMEVAERTEEAMHYVANKTGVFCYVWLDAQAGQLRFSTKKDPDIEDAFEVKVVRENHLIRLIDDIYVWADESVSLDEDGHDMDEMNDGGLDRERNLSVRVFVVEP